MRFNYVKPGTIFKDKVFGDAYKVLSVDDDAKTAVALKFDAETDETVPDTEITVTEANCISFRAVYIPNDLKEYDGFAVEDGILCKTEADGSLTPVSEQGELCFKHIIAYIPGRIVLEAKTRANIAEDIKDRYVDYVIYEVERDRYKTFATCVAPIGFYKKTKDALLLVGNSVEDAESVNEDGEVVKYKVSRGMDAYAIRVNEKSVEIQSYHDNLALDFKNAIELPDGSFIVKSFGEVKDDDCGIIEETQASDTVYYTIPSIKDFFRSAPVCYAFQIPKELEITSVTKTVIANVGKYFVRGEDFFLRCDGSVVKCDALKTVPDYKYLVDVSGCNCESKVKLTLANDKFDTVVVTITETNDRGRIVKLG